MVILIQTEHTHLFPISVISGESSILIFPAFALMVIVVPKIFHHYDICATCNEGYTGIHCDKRCLQNCNITCQCNITCRENNQTCQDTPNINGTILQQNITLNGTVDISNGTFILSFINLANGTFNISNGIFNIKNSLISSLLLIFDSSEVLLDLGSQIIATKCLELNNTLVVIDLSNVNATKNNVTKDLIKYNCSNISGLSFKVINVPAGVCVSTGSNDNSIYVIYAQCKGDDSQYWTWFVVLPVVGGVFVLIAIFVTIVCTVPAAKKLLFPHREKSKERTQKKRNQEIKGKKK